MVIAAISAYIPLLQYRLKKLHNDLPPTAKKSGEHHGSKKET
jgi:hypothetical protein